MLILIVILSAALGMMSTIAIYERSLHQLDDKIDVIRQHCSGIYNRIEVIQRKIEELLKKGDKNE